MKIWYCAPNRQKVLEYKIPDLAEIIDFYGICKTQHRKIQLFSSGHVCTSNSALFNRTEEYEGANPQKRPPPWQSLMPGLAAWLRYQQPPAPGNLITMGWLTWHTKDFFQILNSLTANCVPAGTKNSLSKDFLLAKHTSHKHPNHDEPFSPPAAWF